MKSGDVTRKVILYLAGIAGITFFSFSGSLTGLLVGGFFGILLESITMKHGAYTGATIGSFVLLADLLWFCTWKKVTSIFWIYIQKMYFIAYMY